MAIIINIIIITDDIVFIDQHSVSVSFRVFGAKNLTENYEQNITFLTRFKKVKNSG